MTKKKSSPTRFQASLIQATLLVTASVLSGCTEGRESLHELDHVTPAHWPSSLGDAAEKLSVRTRTLAQPATSEPQEEIQRELVEIVGWIPEIAGDTDMVESDWVKIHQASENVIKQMKSRSPDWTSLSKSIDALADQLRAAQLGLDTSRNNLIEP